MAGSVLSFTATDMMKDGWGYKNIFYPTTNEPLKDTLNREIMLLGNPAIFTTCRKLYGVKYEDKQRKANIQKTLDFFHDVFGTEELFTSWMTKRSSVLSPWNSPYTYDNRKTKKVTIPKRAFVLCDIGDSGVMFVSDQEFDEKNAPADAWSGNYWHRGGWSGEYYD